MLEPRRTVIDLRKQDEFVFNFPDGQPHLSLDGDISHKDNVVLVARISSSDDLLRVLLAKDILDRRRIRHVHLAITYLLGARMDRPMPFDGRDHPFTLRVITNVINAAGFDSISIFDPHSDVAPALLNATVASPVRYVSLALSRVSDPMIVIPDAGAIKRIHAVMEQMHGKHRTLDTAQCLKERDMSTGKLSRFSVVDQVKGRNLLIVDDICDGGGTFIGLAEKLLDAGANEVNLYVSHGIFSKGLTLPGIKMISTTDSYRKIETEGQPGFYQDGFGVYG